MQPTIGQLAQVIGGQLIGPAEVADMPVGRSIVGNIADATRLEAVVLWEIAPRRGHLQRSDAQDSAPNQHCGQHCGIVTTKTTDNSRIGWQVVVEDVAAALRRYASWRRKRFAGEVVAVAGPIGKSTTRRMIEHLADVNHGFSQASGAREGAASPYDVLLALTELTNQPVAVIECGGSDELQLCDPTIAVLTSHPTSAGFGREVVAAQAALGALSARTHVILPGNIRVDDEARLAVSRITTYGREADCDLALRHVRCAGGRLSFFIGETKFEIPVWGRHHAPAAAAAIAVAQAWNQPILEIVTKLNKFSSHAEGCSVFHHANMTLINDTRHVGRDSLRSALEMLREVSANTSGLGPGQNGRKIVVCESLVDGDDNSPEVSRKFGEQIISIGGADLLLAIGQHADEVAQAAQAAGLPASAARIHNQQHKQTHKSTQRVAMKDGAVEAIAAALTEMLRPGDTVLFKSGPSGRLDRVIATIKQENNFVPWESLDLGSVLPSATVV